MSSTTAYVDVADLLRHGARTGIQRVVSQVVPRLVAAADDELQLRMVRFDPVEHDYQELDTDSMLEVLAGTTESPAFGTPRCRRLRTVGRLPRPRLGLELPAEAVGAVPDPEGRRGDDRQLSLRPGP